MTSSLDGPAGVRVRTRVARRSRRMKRSTRRRPPEDRDAQDRGSEPERDLTAAETEADHGRDPEDRRRRDADDEIGSTKDDASAEESDARQDAERKTHEIERDERVVGSPRGRQEGVRLDHRHRRREADEHRGPKPCRSSVLLAVEAEERPGDQREPEPQRDVSPIQFERHRRPGSSLDELVPWFVGIGLAEGST